MTQVLITQHQETESRIGDLDVPQITLLGSLDDEKETSGLGLDAASPKPIMAIIYNGI